MTYITGFIAAVPRENRQAFIRHARISAEAFHEHGLLTALEGWGEDIGADDGREVSFPKSVLARPEEDVLFSFYLWKDRAAQDRGVAKAMADPRLNPETNPMPFDGQRVIYGGFAPVLELGRPLPGGFFDGYVVPVKRELRSAYEEFARFCAPIMVEHGAGWVVEAWEDDVPDGVLTDFRRAVAAQPDEAIVFSWAQWPDRATRDTGATRFFNDPRLQGDECPFDMTRMLHGGFSPVVLSHAKA